ncbi:MAG: hypothetical protein ABII27_07605 [bacterium]
MKRYIVVCVSVVLFLGSIGSPVILAAEGGIKPMFGSCCIGPRIGLEMNENIEIKTIEWVRFAVNIVAAPIGSCISGIYQGSDNGFGGFLASCCIGPRVGEQLDQRKIRALEWLYLVPIVNIVPWIMIGIEAYNGKTMTEIGAAEGLAK